MTSPRGRRPRQLRIPAEGNEQPDLIGAVVGRFLAAVSFETGARPDYPSLRALFVNGAHLTPTSSGRPESLTVEEFIASRSAQVASGQLSAFEEQETGHVSEIFGNVAHRFSTYHKAASFEGTSRQTSGMISTQLVRTQQGWRISSMAWDDERPGVSAPVWLSYRARAARSEGRDDGPGASHSIPTVR